MGSVQAGDWMDHMVLTVWAVEVISLPKLCGVFLIIFFMLEM